MGRIGEVVSRTWRTASKMKEFRGPLKEEKREGVDNERVKVSLRSKALTGVAHVYASDGVLHLNSATLQSIRSTQRSFSARPKSLATSAWASWPTSCCGHLQTLAFGQRWSSKAASSRGQT